MNFYIHANPSIVPDFTIWFMLKNEVGWEKECALVNLISVTLENRKEHFESFQIAIR